MVKELQLSRGMIALVDDEDYDWLIQYKWYANTFSGRWYAATKGMGDGETTLLHRLIMNPPNGMQVDHINHNGLDCRRCNMRIVTPSQNMMNKIKQKSKYSKPCSSRFKGVHWDKLNNCWKTEIMINRKHVWIGRFEYEIDAAHAYDVKAKELFGEYVWLNFPEELK